MESTRNAVAVLVEHFHRNLAAYRSQGYNETQVRREFIDPFFEALGWDVANRAGYAEPYKDVIHEDAIKVGGATKAPDYCFRIGGTRKFFLEAKKPSVDVKGDIAPAYQLRRYGWSAKLPLSILTDFEEFAVYDCRQRPKPTDGVATGRILYLTCGDYLDRFSEIYDVFARESVLRGSFDKFAESATGKRGTQEVDAAFLAEIEGWREALAKNLALRNPSLSVRDLNFAVQVTIDRIIFLRMCEDRGIEPYAQLQSLLNGGEVYPRLVDILHQADDKYNSGLFDFKVDALTPSLAIDDKVLKDLFARLYYPESPYEFSVLGADILGNVYEQFLGKVIRLTAGHQAKVEEKPEVKKAGGVYYTPTYICDYIVKQTVGKLVEDKTPKQVAKLRILDPACGSGSFLLAAYQYLLDWHRDWYVAHGPEKHTEEIYPCSRELIRQKGGDSIRDYKLTTREKKRILLNNLYGVDIDSQAVEVTKLSLLLKVLEGENKDTLESQLSLWRERALPDLGNNIKCGNSLIGPDFYSQQTLALDEEEMYRINAFDWEREFPEIMKAGGFDAVIGNPPYGAYLYDTEKAYLAAKFPCQNYQLDSYQLFLEQAVRRLLKPNGFYGMIIPNPWLTNLLQRAIRKLVTETTRMVSIVHFQFPVFRGVTVDTEIVILQKASPGTWRVQVMVVETLDSFTQPASGSEIQVIGHEQEKWRQLDGGVMNIFTSPEEERLVSKCRESSIRLDALSAINVGIKPYQSGKGVPPQTKETVRTRPYDSENCDDASYRPYLRGTDIGRYKIAPAKSRFIKYGPWLAEPRPAANFDAAVKIVMRQTGDSLTAALDTQQYLCLNNMHVLVPKEMLPAPTYLLGVINSKLLNWYYHSLNPEVGEAFAEVKKTNVAQLSIRPIDFSSPSDVAKHDHMVELVERMLDLHKRLAAAQTPHDKELLQRQIAATDQQIDRLVYELYELTEEEIGIVEGRDNS